LKKSKGELVQTYYEAFKPVLIRITQEDGYTPFDTLNFIMGKPELREKVRYLILVLTYRYLDKRHSVLDKKFQAQKNNK
jgi:hypothetical protein